MKRLVKDLWTDGVKQYRGNPKDGFTPIDEAKVEEIINKIKARDTVKESGPVTLFPADKMEEKPVDPEAE
jgi:hypothetical protein